MIETTKRNIMFALTALLTVFVILTTFEVITQMIFAWAFGVAGIALCITWWLFNYIDKDTMKRNRIEWQAEQDAKDWKYYLQQLKKQLLRKDV